MIIHKTSKYKRDLKQKIINKHMNDELNRINSIELFFKSKNNFNEVMLDPLKNIYKIEKKSGDLKEFYTAHVNGKIRLLIKPIGDYPYDLIVITNIEFQGIDDHHYGEG